ncbi:MAG: hypothetical protein NO110_07370 [Sulfolobales archaeon]|jgi:hypothetical protein|nr:hypothetical protein [Sulfolobales archaeon]
MQEKKANKLARRDLALLKKVAEYYLQYKRIVDLGRLLKQMGGNVEYDADKESLAHAINGLYYYISYVITKEALRAAEMAWREKLTKREFSNDFGGEIYGELDVPRTIVTYPYRVYSFYTIERGTDAPEFAVLGALLREIYTGVKGLKEQLEGYYKDTDALRIFDLKKFDLYLRQLKYYSEKFRKGKIRAPSRRDPMWLRRAFHAYETLNSIVEKRVTVGKRIKKAKGETEKEILMMLRWKLYEVFVFYLIVRYLEKREYRVRRVKRGEHDYSSFVAEKGKEKLFLTFNVPLHFSSLEGVGDLEKEKEKFKGRPDISLINGKRIIFECKYSSSPSYITQGRFKVMAYMYEYEPDVAVLVYPGLETKARPDASDDEATIDLDSKIKGDKRYIDFRFRTKEGVIKKIYMAILDPELEPEGEKKDEEKDNVNLQVIKSILDEVLEPHQ